MPHIRPACTPCTKGTKHRYPSWTQDCSRSCQALRPPCHPRQTTHPRRCQVRLCMPLSLCYNHAFFISVYLPPHLCAGHTFVPRAASSRRLVVADAAEVSRSRTTLKISYKRTCANCSPGLAQLLLLRSLGYTALSNRPPSTADLCRKIFGFILWACLSCTSSPDVAY
jgi:hypothetical protein